MAIPSRIIHFYVFIFYFLCTLGIALAVRWDDAHLFTDLRKLQDPRSNSPVIVAIFKDGQRTLAGFINGCLIMSNMSAANTSLYISSRTLYGLLYGLHGSNVVSRVLRSLSSVWATTRVPTRALFVTFIIFYALPWINLVDNVTVDSVLRTLSLTSSASCIVCWASLCFSFHRFEKW
jgi:amino acid transporter